MQPEANEKENGDREQGRSAFQSFSLSAAHAHEPPGQEPRHDAQPERRAVEIEPLGIAFEAPAGFALQNSPSAVVGRKPQGGRFRFAGGEAKGLDLAGYSNRVWQAAGAQPPQSRPTRINGIDAAISQSERSSQT